VNQIKLYILFYQVLRIYLITKIFAPIKIALVLILCKIIKFSVVYKKTYTPCV